MTGNGFLMRLLQLINESLIESRDLVLRYPNTQSSSRVGHRKILQALGNHNPEQARQAMLAHIQEVMAAYELLEAET